MTNLPNTPGVSPADLAPNKAEMNPATPEDALTIERPGAEAAPERKPRRPRRNLRTRARNGVAHHAQVDTKSGKLEIDGHPFKYDFAGEVEVYDSKAGTVLMVGIPVDSVTIAKRAKKND